MQSNPDDDTECTICGAFNGLLDVTVDFHHWEYRVPDADGMYVCRECHEQLHGGKRISARDDPAGWRQDALKELVRLDADGGVCVPEFQIPEIVAGLADAYNLPYTAKIELKHVLRSEFLDHSGRGVSVSA